MGVFDKVDSSAKVEKENDFVKGSKRKLIPSSIQNCIIKYAYASFAKSGALAVNLSFDVADGDSKGQNFRITEYITSGDAKGNKTFYEKKNKEGKTEKFNLPGFTLIDSMAHLITGKSITECNTEKKTIPLYDFNAKAEKPTDVEMFTELVGKGIAICVLHQIQDKTSQNTQTGDYEPTGKVYEVNVADKFLHPSDRKTWSEMKNNVPADFKDKWLERWEGKVDDQSSEVKGAGLKGAPAVSGDNAEKTDLFA